MRLRAIDLVDVLVYLVVLGLFIQFFPTVISESFVLALLTAVLLKVALELVMALKQRLIARIRRSATTAHRAVSVASLLLVLPASKFVVIEAVALAFGDAVQLGGFFKVTTLIIVLTVARTATRRLLAG